jgi:hypothetical protein
MEGASDKTYGRGVGQDVWKGRRIRRVEGASDKTYGREVLIFMIRYTTYVFVNCNWVATRCSAVVQYTFTHKQYTERQKTNNI